MMELEAAAAAGGEYGSQQNMKKKTASPNDGLVPHHDHHLDHVVRLKIRLGGGRDFLVVYDKVRYSSSSSFPTTLVAKSVTKLLGHLQHPITTTVSETPVMITTTTSNGGCKQEEEEVDDASNKEVLIPNKPKKKKKKKKQLVVSDELVANRHRRPPRVHNHGHGDDDKITVDGKLNDLLDADGGIIKQKLAIQAYLKLLSHLTIITPAAAHADHGGVISSCEPPPPPAAAAVVHTHSTRDISIILEPLLKTKSQIILKNIIVDNKGSEFLHKLLVQNRRNFQRIPIVRKLLKILEYLADKDILTPQLLLIHTSSSSTGSVAGTIVESFRDTILHLANHSDVKIHQAARSFRDKWMPRCTSSFSTRRSSLLLHSDSRMKPREIPASAAISSIQKEEGGSSARHDSNNNSTTSYAAAAAAANGTETRRKRKTQWDEPPPEPEEAAENSSGAHSRVVDNQRRRRTEHHYYSRQAKVQRRRLAPADVHHQQQPLQIRREAALVHHNSGRHLDTRFGERRLPPSDHEVVDTTSSHHNRRMVEQMRRRRSPRHLERSSRRRWYRDDREHSWRRDDEARRRHPPCPWPAERRICF